MSHFIIVNLNTLGHGWRMCHHHAVQHPRWGNQNVVLCTPWCSPFRIWLTHHKNSPEIRVSSVMEFVSRWESQVGSADSSFTALSSFSHVFYTPITIHQSRSIIPHPKFGFTLWAIKSTTVVLYHPHFVQGSELFPKWDASEVSIRRNQDLTHTKPKVPNTVSHQGTWFTLSFPAFQKRNNYTFTSTT